MTGGQFVPAKRQRKLSGNQKSSWYGAKAYAEHYGRTLAYRGGMGILTARGGNSSNGYHLQRQQ